MTAWLENLDVIQSKGILKNEPWINAEKDKDNRQTNMTVDSLNMKEATRLNYEVKKNVCHISGFHVGKC